MVEIFPFRTTEFLGKIHLTYTCSFGVFYMAQEGVGIKIVSVLELPYLLE